MATDIPPQHLPVAVSHSTLPEPSLETRLSADALQWKRFEHHLNRSGWLTPAHVPIGSGDRLQSNPI
jgi:hypothetical protein